MDNPLFVSYLVEERSYVSFIKRELHNLIRPVFSETRVAEIDIVIAELTSNLIKHAGSGEILYRLSMEKDEPVFEILCIDNGPGIADIPHSMKDGISSTNTLGHGFGSISRLSSFFQLYSQEDWGTIAYSRNYNTPDHHPAKRSRNLRVLNVAKPGEVVSGDGYFMREVGFYTVILAGDGLGHGPHAKEAIDAAIAQFIKCDQADPAAIIREINTAVKKTRGLVATVIVLDSRNQQWLLCGVGNISTRLYQGIEYKNYIPNNGIIGLNVPTRLENNVLEMEKYQQLICCSDGINTRWDLHKYPGILKYDPMVMAAAIYKDHARRTDDMTILIVKLT